MEAAAKEYWPPKWVSSEMELFVKSIAALLSNFSSAAAEAMLHAAAEADDVDGGHCRPPIEAGSGNFISLFAFMSNSKSGLLGGWQPQQKIANF